MRCYTEEEWWLLSDGLLDAEAVTAMDAHLRACPRCAVLWRGIRRLDDDLRALALKEERCNLMAVSAVGAYLRRRAIRRIVQAAAVAAGIVCATVLLWTLVPSRPHEGGMIAESTPPAGEASEGVAARGPFDAAQRDGTVPTEATPPAEMQFAWGTVSKITSPEALDVVANAKDAFRGRLSRGSARFEVDPAAGTAVVIETPDAVIEVVGTVFTVAVRDVGPIRTEVTVERGKVRVVHAGEAVIVLAGDSFPPREVEVPGTATPPAAVPSGVDVPSPKTEHQSPSGGTIDMPPSARLEY